MGQHYILKCEHCGTTIAQCRCPDPAKTKLWGVCVGCEEKLKLQQETIDRGIDDDEVQRRD